jgi:putative sigma-54 modulation protein
MKINVHSKGIRVGDLMQQRVEEKLSKFNRFFGDDAVANVKITTDVISKSLR